MRPEKQTAPGVDPQSGREPNTPRPQDSTPDPSRQWDFVGAGYMGLAPKPPVGDFETLDNEAARLEGS